MWSCDEGHVEHGKFACKTEDGDAVPAWCRSLPDLLQLCMKKLENSVTIDLDFTGIFFSRDYVKGAYLIIADLLLRRTTLEKETWRLELKLGEISNEKGQGECLEYSIKKINHGLRSMSANELRRGIWILTQHIFHKFCGLSAQIILRVLFSFLNNDTIRLLFFTSIVVNFFCCY